MKTFIKIWKFLGVSSSIIVNLMVGGSIIWCTLNIYEMVQPDETGTIVLFGFIILGIIKAIELTIIDLSVFK